VEGRLLPVIVVDCRLLIGRGENNGEGSGAN